MTGPDLPTTLQLRDGEKASIRPLREDDTDPLSAFFVGLSAETRRVYGPHPFDRETAGRLTSSIDDADTLRFVGVLRDGSPSARIIGYMILTRSIDDNDLKRYGARIKRDLCASFAPSVADQYQNQGFGTQMASHVLECARANGLQQVILMGGVRADNPRAQRLYSKLGFERTGEFWIESAKVMNYDMMLEL